MTGFVRSLPKFVREQRGLAAIELAALLPVMLVVLLGTIEFGRYVLLNQKLQSAATSAADFATREDAITTAQLTDIYSAVQQIVAPFDIGESGNLVVTAVGSDGTESTVLWQSTAAGELGVTSGVGIPGGVATLPGSFPMRADETAIVVEVYFEYTPWLGEMLHSSVISKQSVFRPRFGGLETVES